MNPNAIDDEIAAHLDAGDIEAACLLAAKLPKPEHYLRAMERINAIINEARVRKPVIELFEKDAKLDKYNPRPELHGEDPTPAADVKFSFNAASADILPLLDPMLRSFMFHKNGAVHHDLADAVADAPDLRFPKMQGPYEWLLNLDDAELTIHRGIGGKSDLVLPAKMKKPILLAPQQGGTVIVTMQVQCHPDEKQAGSLYMLMGKPITVSFAPGEEVDDDDEEGEGEE